MHGYPVGYHDHPNSEPELPPPHAPRCGLPRLHASRRTRQRRRYRLRYGKHQHTYGPTARQCK